MVTAVTGCETSHTFSSPSSGGTSGLSPGALHAIRRQGGPKVCPTNGSSLLFPLLIFHFTITQRGRAFSALVLWGLPILNLPWTSIASTGCLFFPCLFTFLLLHSTSFSPSCCVFSFLFNLLLFYFIFSFLPFFRSASFFKLLTSIFCPSPNLSPCNAPYTSSSHHSATFFGANVIHVHFTLSL